MDNDRINGTSSPAIGSNTNQVVQSPATVERVPTSNYYHHHNRRHRRHSRRNRNTNHHQVNNESNQASGSNEEFNRHHRRHSHRHGAGRILVKYLRNAARNSFHNLYDDLTNTINPEMSVHYQNIHDFLNNQMDSPQSRTTMNQQNHSRSSNLNQSQFNEMHEFITINDSTEMSGQLGQPNPHPNVYNPYAPPPARSGLFHLNDFLQDPLNAGLSTLTKVSQIVRSPTTHIIDGASAAYNIANNIFTPRPPGHAERIYHSSSGMIQPPFNGIQHQNMRNQESFNFVEEDDGMPLPPPVLPLIECTIQQNRLEPLTMEEFSANKWTKDELCIRIFKGGIAEDNKLRMRLWPVILGLTDDPQTEFDWTEMNKLYKHYRSQWESILPEQEKRFSLFRERKSLIERDVIRCDRTHPYYHGETESLNRLKSLLLTYMMYDFDTGYVQGMSDLASPLLYVTDGDICKSFWFFTQMMDFTHNNFEMSQMTIKLQLEMLWKLIELTDPIFAQYLTNNDSVNCYFAFRWIVCQFKREFMKTNFDDYQDVLLLWESIWTCSAVRRQLTKLREEEDSKLADVSSEKVEAKSSEQAPEEKQATKNNNTSIYPMKELEDEKLLSSKMENCNLEDKTEMDESNKQETVDLSERSSTPIEVQQRTLSNPNNNIYVPEVKRLSDTELYILCICLCIIRRERDLIMVNRFESTDILKHFNTLQLNSNLKDILIHAANIWSWLVYDGKEALLYAHLESGGVNPFSPSSSSSASSLATGGQTTSNGSTIAQHGSSASVSNSTGGGPLSRTDTDDFDLLTDVRLSNISGEDYFLLNS